MSSAGGKQKFWSKKIMWSTIRREVSRASTCAGICVAGDSSMRAFLESEKVSLRYATIYFLARLVLKWL